MMNALAFNLYDGYHHFSYATKGEALSILTKLLGKSRHSLYAWQDNPDPYLSKAENRKNVQLRKKAVADCERWLKRVENEDSNTAWMLIKVGKALQLRKTKKVW